MTTQENDFIHCQYKRPILTVTVKRSISTDEDIEFAAEIMRTYYMVLEKANKKMSIIYDLRKLDFKRFTMYPKWAALFNSTKDKAERYINKSGILTNSTLFHSATLLYFKLYVPARPYKISYDINELRNFINDI